MRYRVERATATDRDFSEIFDFLVASHIAFGEDESQAIAFARKRLRRINREMNEIGKAPMQGTSRADLMDGLRTVTRQRTIFYFRVNEEKKEVQVLAVFFGAQDHKRRILLRLLSKS